MGTISFAGFTLSATDDEVVQMFAALSEKMSAGESVKAFGDDGDDSPTMALFIPPCVVEVHLERPFTDDERKTLGITSLRGTISSNESGN